MIPPGMLDYYVSKDSIIIWTLADADATTSRIAIKGFNYAREVADYGTQINTPCNNIWLQDDNRMHSMQELICILTHE